MPPWFTATVRPARSAIPAMPLSAVATMPCESSSFCSTANTTRSGDPARAVTTEVAPADDMSTCPALIASAAGAKASNGSVAVTDPPTSARASSRPPDAWQSVRMFCVDSAPTRSWAVSPSEAEQPASASTARPMTGRERERIMRDLL